MILKIFLNFQLSTHEKSSAHLIFLNSVSVNLSFERRDPCFGTTFETAESL